MDGLSALEPPLRELIRPRQSADRVAERIARALAHPTPEIYPYRLSRALTLLNASAPGFCDRVVKRWGREPIHV